MSGQQPKSHHFVHRAYLEGLQDPKPEREGSSRLWVYMPGKSPFPQLPERVAKRNYYYCYQGEEKRQFLAEHVLQQLEGVSVSILRQLRERRFMLRDEDRLTFAGYVALSHTRVPTFEQSMSRFAAFFEAKRLEAVINDRHGLNGPLQR